MPDRVRRMALFSLALGAIAGFSRASDSEPELRDGIVGEAFAPRSGPRSDTLFKTLDPAETGIDTVNAYDDPTMWSERYREFTLGAIGTGIAAGDFDGDGRCDFYVVNKTKPNQLWRNLGQFHFEDVTEAAGVGGSGEAWCQGAAFADIDNDGDLDLYVCRFDAPNFLFINNGDGTFGENAEAAGLAVKDASGMAAFCDYDRDGWLDVYVQTNILDADTRPDGQPDFLFHNNGDGTFSDVTRAAGIKGETQGHSTTWWDYNNDGWPDIYIANDFRVRDTLYHNNGNGTFTNTLDYAVPHIPRSSKGADQGDVNNDGLIDLFVGDTAAASHYKDARGMANLRAGTFDYPDRPLGAPQHMRNALFLSTGTGYCLEAAFLTGLAATDWTWSTRFEDFDNDGRLDLHVTNGMVRELHNSDVVDRMMATEDIQERVRIMKATPRLDENNLAFRNLGDLKFESVGNEWGLDQHGFSLGSALADLDNDGDIDIVFANYDGAPSVRRNDSAENNGLIVQLRGTSANSFGVGATVKVRSAFGTQIRQLVLARGYASTSEPALHFGLGSDQSIDRLVVTWPNGRTQEFENLPANHRYTITEPTEAPPPLLSPVEVIKSLPVGQFVEIGQQEQISLQAPEPNFDEFSSEPLLPIRLDRLGPGVAFGDVNEDGIDDFVFGGPTGVRTQLYVALAREQYLPEIAFGFDRPTATADASALIFDANGDGKNDLLMTKGGTAMAAGDPAYQPTLLLNRGRASWSNAPPEALPELYISAGPAVAADFDRDGALDVFIGGRTNPGRYPTSPRSALLANREGRFVDVTAELAPDLAKIGMIQSALWSDVDNDGWPDLLVALQWGGVHFFRNNEGAGFEDWSERAGFATAGNGWWNSLAAADFNGDGQPDYVAGNLGFNTRYHATEEHPAVLYYGEFDDRSGPQILEGFYEGDVLYPNRGRDEFIAAMPSLRKFFPKYENFARAPLELIATPERLAEAQLFTATNFSSGVFLSQADGNFAFKPLPRIAQIAPIFGVAAGDFDGDGHADIYALQNSKAPIPEIGRFDGGLSQLLHGDGEGGFVPVPLEASGLNAPNDPKALGVFDFDIDGWPDFFITRNNDRSLLYRNGGLPGRHSFAIALEGPKSNRSAISARITVELTDGTTQTSEVAAGSGYLSQSSAAQFFGYADGNPPCEIRVRWPDGSATTHPWMGFEPRIFLSPQTEKNLEQ